MLKLINVCKSYKCGKNKVSVLDNINLDFKKQELVFILGKSGSGKSTLLNIIGGILDVDSGSVMLDDKDITKFSNSMLCNYRNNMIGYIFQDYHLVEYMSVIDNIKLGMTVTNNDSNSIENILKKLGIYSKRKVKVNKLSGGEKQRVAIARAIINNPDIILCDEPTGALDSSNSLTIMNILKEISKEKLVIVVSHDNILANKYADRVINIVDGKVDYYPQIDDGKFKDIKRKKISLFQIIKLAIKNLCLKKGRTFFTSLTVSIGLVCMLLVLCLSKSFSDDIDRLERDVVSIFPISVYNGEFEVASVENDNIDDKINIRRKNNYVHTNKITKNYLDYVNSLDEVSYIGYDYDISMPIITDSYKRISDGYFRVMPDGSFILDNYELLYGKNSSSIYDVVLKVDSNNNVDEELLNAFGIDSDIEYKDIIGRKIKVILNDLFYFKNGDYYFANDNYSEMYKNSDIELEIVGIVREREMVDDNNYLYVNNSLIESVLEVNKNSKIVIEQLNTSYNVLGLDISKDDLLSFLGYESLPNGINIYVSNLEDKDIVLDKLDEYNNKNNKLVYVDMMQETINILRDVINFITVILVVFSMISILVSGLMIFILTNNRVMERVKEIGILMSLGARKKDITRLFNIENLIIGVFSSFIGIIVIKMLVNPINSLIGIILDGEGMFRIYVNLVIISIIFNIFIVVLSGYIPTKMAGRKKIIDCISGRV